MSQTNLQNWVEETLQEQVTENQILYGGDTGKNQVFFTETHAALVKTYDNNAIADSEALGLAVIADSNSFQTPLILARREGAIMLNYIEAGQPLEVYWRRFAKQLIALHQQTAENFGFTQNTFCGQTLQDNTPNPNWADFFVQQRLAPLVDQLRNDTLTKLFQTKQDKIHMFILDVTEAPSLVHGDLWGGNHICDISQKPFLIDPAVYYGHRETDLAMMKLFGGFHDTTFWVYNELWPLEDGWQQREKIYQLFHLLNHALIKGGHYLTNAINKLQTI